MRGMRFTAPPKPDAPPAAAPAAAPTMPPPQGPLPADQWLAIVRHAPLVSVDLVCEDPQGRVLLGWRENRPARHTWFVPGGVIRKNERVAQALARVLQAELALDTSAGLPPLHSLGTWQHLYPDDNFANEPGTATHYLVLAWRLQLSAAQAAALQPDSQHARLRWFSVPELLAEPAVHANTRAYFDPAEAGPRLLP